MLLPFMFMISMHPRMTDVGLLIFLGVFSTAMAHTLFTSSLKRIPAQLAGIVGSLESVYGILLALIILREIPSFREIAGAVVIIGMAIAGQVMHEKKKSYS